MFCFNIYAYINSVHRLNCVCARSGQFSGAGGEELASAAKTSRCSESCKKLPRCQSEAREPEVLLTSVKDDALWNAFYLTVTASEGSADTMVLTQFSRKVGHLLFARVLTSAHPQVCDSERPKIHHA